MSTEEILGIWGPGRTASNPINFLVDCPIVVGVRTNVSHVSFWQKHRKNSQWKHVKTPLLWHVATLAVHPQKTWGSMLFTYVCIVPCSGHTYRRPGRKQTSDWNHRLLGYRSSSQISNYIISKTPTWRIRRFTSFLGGDFSAFSARLAGPGKVGINKGIGAHPWFALMFGSIQS